MRRVLRSAPRPLRRSRPRREVPSDEELPTLCLGRSGRCSVRPGASWSGGWQSDASSVSATHFGPFSSGTESIWCRNSASVGKRVSRQTLDPGQLASSLLPRSHLSDETRCDGKGGEGGRLVVRDSVEVRVWRYEDGGANHRMMQTSVRASYQRVLSRKEPFLCLP